MLRKLGITVVLVVMSASSAFSMGSSKYSGYDRETGTVIAAVHIKEEGLYNLFIGIQFLKKPRNEKIFKSDEYDKLVDRLSVEARGLALQKVLDRNELTLADLAGLKKSIEADIGNLVARLKKQYLPVDEDAEVVFAISDFFLLEPSDQ